mgnify:FL=1|tara:strand:+ start:2653 stop:3144 length:492 start_codon:yes stop_codon:yes gene_type:complete
MNNQDIDLVSYISKLELKQHEDTIWKLENIDLYNKFTQYIYNEKIKDNKVLNETEKLQVTDNLVNKKIKISPIELICKNNKIIYNELSLKYIKEKLVNMITLKEFSKNFGNKKSSEIMNGVINNKWNTSLALFMSFLFNSKIIYQGKDILFKKDLINYSIITI